MKRLWMALLAIALVTPVWADEPDPYKPKLDDVTNAQLDQMKSILASLQKRLQDHRAVQTQLETQLRAKGQELKRKPDDKSLLEEIVRLQSALTDNASAATRLTDRMNELKQREYAVFGAAVRRAAERTDARAVEAAARQAADSATALGLLALQGVRKLDAKQAAEAKRLFGLALAAKERARSDEQARMRLLAQALDLVQAAGAKKEAAMLRTRIQELSDREAARSSRGVLDAIESLRAEIRALRGEVAELRTLLTKQNPR